MSRFSALEDFTEIAQPSLKDVEFFRFNSLVPDAKIALQDSQFSFEKYPANVSLLACSSKYGYFVAGSIHGFLFGDTKSVRDALHKAGKGKVEKLEKKTTIPIEQGPVHQLRLSADELSVVVAVAGGHVFIYSVKDIVANGQNTQPTKHYQLGGDILDLRPNPEDLPNLCAIRMKESCVIIKLDSGEIALTLDRQDITAICWSPKGKQIVCGTHLGQLYHYDTQGNQKDSIDIPKEMRGGVEDESENRYVQDVLWVETHVFLAIYSRRRETSNDEHVNDAYAIKRSIKSGSVAYTRLAEVTPVFSCDGRDGHFYMETIRDFGREIKHLIILANTATGEVSVVGEDENQEWATWMLEETGIANLPLSEEDSTDTFPLGLALDFSSMEPLPPFDQSESEKNVDPMPTIYFINDEGHMLAYHCYNKEMARRGEAFKGMKESQSVHYALTTAPAPVQPASAFVAALSSNNVNTTPTFGQLNQFAQYDSGANTTSSFASLLSGDETGSNAISTTGVFGAAIQKQQSGSAFSGFASANISTTPTEKSSLFRTLAVNSAVPSAPTPGRMGQGTPAFGAPSMPAFGATTAIGYGQNLSSVATPIQPLVAFSTQANNDKANNDTPTAPAPAPAPPTSTSTSTSSPAEPVKSTGFVGFGQTQPFGEMKSVFPLKKSADVGFGFGSSPTSSFSQPSPVPVPIFGSASKTPAFGENKPVTSSSLANDSKPVQPSEKKMPDFGSLALSTPPPKEVKPSAFSVSQTATSDAKIPAFGGIKSSSTPKVLFTAPKPVVPAPEDESEKDDEKEEESEEEFSMGSSRLHLATPGPLNSTSYRPNSVPAATESKLVFNFGTSKPVFAVPAPPASNLSSVSTAEPKKSFAHRSDFVSPVAEVKKNNVFDTKSMSPPSEVKQEHVFAVPEPKFGLSFGSTKPAASSPVPPLKQSATSFKSVSFSPVTPSKAESQYKTDEISPPKPRVSTAKEGMAKTFEMVYFEILDSFDLMQYRHEQLSEAIQRQEKQQAAPRLLADPLDKWILGNADELGDVVRRLVGEASELEKDVKQLKKEFDGILQDIVKLKGKEETFKNYSGKDKDPGIQQQLRERQLDSETRTKWAMTSAKCESVGKVMAQLESKVYSFKQRSRHHKIPHSISLYSLRRTLRDIEKEVVNKDNVIHEIEEKLGNLQLDNNHKKAASRGKCYTLEDSDSDGEEQKMQSAQTSILTSNTPLPDKTIQTAARRLKLEYFLSGLCNAVDTVN